jgi:hypothetical protein
MFGVEAKGRAAFAAFLSSLGLQKGTLMIHGFGSEMYNDGYPPPAPHLETRRPLLP